MAGSGELIASAVFKLVFDKLGSTIWQEIGSQLNLRADLEGLRTTLDHIQRVVRNAEKRSIKDGEVCVWMRKLKFAAYDMEDMLIDCEYQISRKTNDSTPATKGSIPHNLRRTMPDKLKEMKRRLEEILNLKRFDLDADTSSDNQDMIQTLPTGPIIGEGIVGRVNDKAEIMELLKRDREHCIIPIYGFAGLGKTSLAQMVYNDSRISESFDIQAWVHVSTKFDIAQIGRSIISQVDGQSNQFDLPSVQKRLQTILAENRSLVILDDLWEENADNLERIRTMLRGGKPGSKVIVTTRSERVAERMNSKLPFKLDVLPAEDCWNLFRAMAFPTGVIDHQTLEKEKEKVGQQIVERCRGVPLAVKSLAYRLQNEPLRKWEETLKSDLWEEEQNPTLATRSTAILPSLKLSYYYMPEYLRPCFAYFAAFPKGFVVEKISLIQRWTALGFVAPTHHPDDYLRELVGMSFLQAVSVSPPISQRYCKPPSTLFQMHDLVHQLAMSVFSDEVAVSDGSRGGRSWLKMENCWYMLFSNFNGWAPQRNSMPSKARAIHFKDCTALKPSPNIFSKMKWLRVLDLSGLGTAELPESMRNLHHLQVLNVSENTCLTMLPSLICDFQKLSYLDLHSCSSIIELPESIHKLSELIYLDLSKCSSLREIPMNSQGLQKLSSLNLSGCSQLEKIPDSFGCLENLKDLNMSCCWLKQLPANFFKDMKEIRFLNFSGCVSLRELPELGGNNRGHLLEMLDLSGCAKLSGLPESYGLLSELRYVNLSGCAQFQNIMVFLTNCKFIKLEYLNLSGVGLGGHSEAPTTSAGGRSRNPREEFEWMSFHREGPTTFAGGSSQNPREELELISVLREEIIQCMGCLKYLSVGGYTLFSEQGIALLKDLQTLPIFRVDRQGDYGRSNIDLLGKILGTTQHKLHIECLENVMTPEEADKVEIGGKQLHSLSLEWSSGISHFQCNPREILEKLRPHHDLQVLIIKGYTEDTFPEWIMRTDDTLPNLVKIVLSDLNCSDLHLHGSNLKELEIRNVRLLQEVRIGPCRKLRWLLLIAIGSGATLKLIDGTQGEERHHRQADHVQETRVTELGGNLMGKGKRIFTQTMNLFKRSSRAPEPSEQSKTLTSEVLQTSPSLSSSGPSEEANIAFPVLKYLKIESCQGLKFDPCIPKSTQYHIITSSPDPLMCLWPSSSALTSNIGISGCSKDDIKKWIEIVSINTEKLSIDKCKGFQRLEHFYSDSGDLGCLQEVTYVNYIEDAHFVVKPSNGELNCSSSNIALLHQYHDKYNCYHLAIKNIENVRSHEEVSEGLTRYDQLRSLSLEWSACHTIPTLSGHSSTCCRTSPTSVLSIMDKLRPPRGLNTLRIKGYMDFPLCSWMKDIGSVLPELKLLELARLSELTTIPKAIQNCHVLEGLEIVDCWNFAEVPKWLKELKCLRYLTLHAAKLTHLPLCIKSMKNLEGLTLKKCNHKLRERCLSGDDKDKIRHINYIHTDEVMTFPVKPINEQGRPYSSNLSLLFDGHGWECNELIIENLENVKSDEEISQEELDRCYRQLLSLTLKWSGCSYSSNSSEVEDTLVLEKLQPPKRIGSVRVEGYRGATFGTSSWIMNTSSILPHVTKLELAHMEICEQLPPLGQLAKLEELHISFMPSIKVVDAGFYGGSRPFVKLRKLILDSMENLVEWANTCTFNGEDKQQQQELDRIFPNLQTLVIKNCPRLGYSSILTESGHANIRERSEVLSMPEFVRCCKCLRELEIDSWNFAEVPEWLGELTCLEELTLHAAKILHLPLCIKTMTSIRKLTLKKCNYQLRERCNSGDDKDKIEHINHINTDEGPNFTMSSSGIMDFPEITASQLIEINIQQLQQINQEAAAKLNLSSKNQLRYLSLEWASSRMGSVAEDKAVLENLQPHHYLERLCIRNYSGDGFPSWISLLPKLLRLELDGLQWGNLPVLDQLQNLEELIISRVSATAIINFYNCTTQPHKKLRSIILSDLQNVSLRTSSSLQEQEVCYEDKFPNLQILEIHNCRQLRSQPSIPRSERYIISGSLLEKGFRLPSVQQVMDPSNSSASSKLEIMKSDFSLELSDIWESFRQSNISELTMNGVKNRGALTQSIMGWESLQKLEIVGGCSNITEASMYYWRGNAFLRELRLETMMMSTLPTYIQKLRALETLILLNVCKELEDRCSPTGQDWIKIEHIRNVHIERANLHDQ